MTRKRKKDYYFDLEDRCKVLEAENLKLKSIIQQYKQKEYDWLVNAQKLENFEKLLKAEVLDFSQSETDVDNLDQTLSSAKMITTEFLKL